MSDQSNLPEDKKPLSLFARFALGFLASGITSYTLTFCSLHGVDFELLGVNSEGIKASITALLTGVATTPECIPKSIALFIIFCRMSVRTVKNALTSKLPDDKE